MTSPSAVLAALALGLALACGGGAGSGAGAGSSTGGATNPVCAAGTSTGAVQRPQFVRNIPSGQTGWFASPAVADLDHDGNNKLIAGYYSLFVYDPSGRKLAQADGNGSRIYAPFVVTDLDGDGTTEIVCGQGSLVYAYEWKAGGLHVKAG